MCPYRVFFRGVECFPFKAPCCLRLSAWTETLSSFHILPMQVRHYLNNKRKRTGETYRLHHKCLEAKKRQPTPTQVHLCQAPHGM